MSNPSLDNYLMYRNDPWLFLTQCVFTKDQVDRDEPIKLFPDKEYLKLYAKLWSKYPLLCIPKTRRMTMSWASIGLYVWDTIFHRGRFQAFVSKKEDDAHELIMRAKFIVDHIPNDKLPKELVPKYDHKFCVLDFPELDSKIQGFPQGADQLRQFTFSGIFGDESAFWEHAQAFYSASFPTIEGGGRMTLVSSPAPGFFKKLVFDALDQPGDINVAEYAPEFKTPMQGTRIWTNKKNKFLILELHYTADPAKRAPEFKESIKNSMPLMDYLREYELAWDTFSGQPVYPEFSKLHITSAKPTPVAGVPMVVGFDFGLCYSDDTEVLTEDGWKLFKDVGDERVATLNPQTFELQYEKPKFKVDMPYSGEMLIHDSFNASFCVTPDHIMPIWYDKSEFRRYFAKDALKYPRHKYLRLTANWKGEELPNELGLSPKLYAAFMGAYLSEGTVDKEHNRVGITQLKDSCWIRTLLGQLPIKYQRDNTGYRFSDKMFADHLRPFGTQEKRYVPDCIKQATPDVICEFINTYTLGDGHIRTRDNGAEEHSIYTCSRRMADDLSELALKVGWYASIAYVEPSKSWFEKDQRFIISTGGYSVTFKKRCDFTELQRERIEKIQYNGRVYCLSVKNSILYVRRNGRAHWNGNTPAAVVGQFENGVLTIFKEYVQINMGAVRFVPMVIQDIMMRWPSKSDLRKDWRCFIDPSGINRSDTDESSCAQVLMQNGFVPAPGPIAFEDRRKAVANFLMQMTKDGPAFQIYGIECPVLIKGFEGGYRFNEKAVEIEPGKLRPIKDSFSHPHDALQYVCSGVRGLQSSFRLNIPIAHYGLTSSGGGYGKARLR